MKLIRFLFDIFDVFSKASEIRRDEERRERSVRFAVSSIVYSVIAVAAVLFGLFLMSVREESGILVIFLIAIAATFFAGGLVTFIGALLRVIAQFTINRKPMTWIALVVLLLAVGVSVAFIFSF